jgi:hypothetical protein
MLGGMLGGLSSTLCQPGLCGAAVQMPIERGGKRSRAHDGGRGRAAASGQETTLGSALLGRPCGVQPVARRGSIVAGRAEPGCASGAGQRPGDAAGDAAGPQPLCMHGDLSHCAQHIGSRREARRYTTAGS